MAIFRRTLVFILVNALVLVTISFLLEIFRIRPFLSNHGIDHRALLALCAVWGATGSLVSLFFSRWLVSALLDVQLIDPEGKDRDIYELVAGVAQQVGIFPPRVGIYESKEINALATGPSQDHALIALSSALVDKMNPEQLRGIIAHEMAHIANGDMVTMTLLQALLNTFVLFFSKSLAFALARSSKSEKSKSFDYRFYSSYSWLLESVFGIASLLIVAAVSRWREFRADREGAELVGYREMVSALSALEEVQTPSAQHATLAALKISGESKGWIALLATHPPLAERIERLKEKLS